MLQTKTTKRGIIDRIVNLDKATMQGKKPHLVMISLTDDNKSWRIQEHYFKPNKQVDYKEYFYEDYNDYLAKADLDKNTPVIVNDLPRVD